MQYFVDCKAAPGGDGSKALPFRTISGAAAIARPGDEVPHSKADASQRQYYHYCNDNRSEKRSATVPRPRRMLAPSWHERHLSTSDLLFSR